MTLHQGWNLFGVPFDPKTSSVLDALGENMTHISALFGYDNGIWTYWIRGMPSTLNNFKCGKGYWANAQQGFSLSLRGTDGAASVLKAGWNLIATNTTTSVPLEDYLSGVDWNYICTWDSVSSRWLYNIRGIGGDPHDMAPGMGYWVQVP